MGRRKSVPTSKYILFAVSQKKMDDEGLTFHELLLRGN